MLDDVVSADGVSLDDVVVVVEDVGVLGDGEVDGVVLHPFVVSFFASPMNARP
jgi:hypothetical protein